MAERHIPGPWKVARRRPAGRIQIAQADSGQVVATVEGWGEAEHNARLIAAAPDLLSMLRRYASECAECNGSGQLHDSIDGFQPATTRDCHECADVRALISKAEGS